MRLRLHRLYIEGGKGVKIWFFPPKPEKCVDDKDLVGLTKEELAKALEKPFVVLCNIAIWIEYKGVTHCFVIPRGYDWNGANVPWFCWLLIGQQKEPRFKLASCVHDYMCEHHDVVGNDRYLSTLVFDTLCEYFGRFNALKRWIMKHSVDNFQKVFGRDLNNKRWENCK